jgi:hypothetical protein
MAGVIGVAAEFHLSRRSNDETRLKDYIINSKSFGLFIYTSFGSTYFGVCGPSRATLSGALRIQMAHTVADDYCPCSRLSNAVSRRRKEM